MAIVNNAFGDLYSRKHLSSLFFFLISVFSNFVIQYNTFEFNRLQWAVLLSEGVTLLVIPFFIEKIVDKMISIKVFAVLNLIFYVPYAFSVESYTPYVLILAVNALLLPLLAVQVVDDATSSDLDVVSRKLSNNSRIPVQRIFWAILISALFGIPTAHLTSDAMLAIILLFLNLLSFCWFFYEHRFNAIVESNYNRIDSSRLIVESENELVDPIADFGDGLQRVESGPINLNVVCTNENFIAFLAELPNLFCYTFYWSLLTVVLIYMYELSCQFSYSKIDINPSYLRVYPLLFTVVFYPIIEWKILPFFNIRKNFHKLLLSTMFAVLALVTATVLESLRVTETYGTDYYFENPFLDNRVSSCPTDLDSYCNDVPIWTHYICDYPPMMSTRLSVGWMSIQFLFLSFSISLTGSCFINFSFYELFPSSPFMSITLSTGFIRLFMAGAIMIQCYNADPSKLGRDLTFNLNKENIPILLVYTFLFIGYFLLYLFLEYILNFFKPLTESDLEETKIIPSSAPLLPVHQEIIGQAFQALPALNTKLVQEDKKYDVFLSYDWGTAATQYINHRRVRAINAKLSAVGLKTWFDEERTEASNMISRAHCVIIFITEQYVSRINSANPVDDCFNDFNFALQQVSTQKIIPVVMEASMKDKKRWEGRLAVELARNHVVDFSDVISNIVPEMITNEIINKVNSRVEREEFDQKCKEIVELVFSGLVKPLKDLTFEQTILFFKSIGCIGIENVFQEKKIVLYGKDLNTVETLEDLMSLDLNLPRIKVRRILQEILYWKENGVRMSNLLDGVIA